MDLWIHQIDLNTLYENLCSVVLSSFFPVTVLLKVCGEWTPALCIPFGQCFHPTDSDPVYQVMTQKRSKGFFVKMFTAWSHLLNWPSFKRFFFVISSLTHANFTRAVFPQFRDFSQGQIKAMGMGEWVNRNASGLWFFFRVHHSSFSHRPKPCSAVKSILWNHRLYMSFL